MKMLFLLFFPIVCFSEDLSELLNEWESSYLETRFTRLINTKEVNAIVEIGSYNALDSILLHQFYDCPVYAFECDFRRFELIEQRFAPYPEIHLVRKGVLDETGEKIFYASEFPGASSFLEFNLDTMSKWNKVSKKELLNPIDGLCRVTKVNVETTRLDEWIEENEIAAIDLLCIDAQGAALNIFKGLGDQLKQVKYIICELEYKPIYEGEALFHKVKNFLASNGFKFQKCRGKGFRNAYFNDFIFLNENLLKNDSCLK